MPRPFTTSDRERVQQRLIRVAREHFIRFGYRRANVGEIAAEAGIAKGTVYLFFPSKGELFAAVARQTEEEMRLRIMDEVGAPPAGLGDHLRRLFRLQEEVFSEHPLLRVVNDPAEAAALFRDLPDEAAAELHASDDRFFAELVQGWAGTPGEHVDPSLLVGAARALYAAGLQRQLVGEAVFPAVMDLLIDGIAAELERRALAAATPA